jgi:protein-tyrosine phosphatase
MSNWFRTYGFADVSDGLFVGAYPLDASDVTTLAAIGIKRILNLAEDQEYRRGERPVVEDALDNADIEEYRLGLVDYGGLPPTALEAAVQEVNRWLDEGTRTYVHCRAGWQRSAAVAAAVIAVRQGIDIDEALAQVRARKPSADPLPHQREDLRRWWQERQAQAAVER